MNLAASEVADRPTARRSDRISLELSIQVIGTDLNGKDFVIDARTVLVSRHGAKILLDLELAPEQEITIGCPGTGKEAAARVVGELGKENGESAYGVAFLDPEVNLWDIEFPPLTESEKAVGRVLLECMSCHTREVAYLKDFEAEALETNQRLSRACKRCGTSLWKLSSSSLPEAKGSVPTTLPPETSVPVLPSQPQRANLRLRACLRHPQLGDEVVTTESVSPAGLSFKSAKNYQDNLPLQVAVPYLPAAANIFAPVQIERAELLPAERLTRYVVSYIRIHRGWPPK